VKRKYINIPIDIWNLSELHPNERVLLAEVASFEQNGRECFMSNESLAQFLHVSEASAKRYLKNLMQLGYLTRSGDRYNRRLLKNEPTKAQKCTNEGSKMSSRRLKSEPTKAQKRANTITDTNTLTKQYTKKAQPSVVLPFETEKFREAWTEWLEYKRTDHRFKYKTAQSEQRALMTLANEHPTESRAIEAIHTAIANGWKGLVFGSSKSRRTRTSGKAALEGGELSNQLRELAETGNITGDNRNRL
jgi:DNA-binding Lrp family transcriptional regulator